MSIARSLGQGCELCMPILLQQQSGRHGGRYICMHSSITRNSCSLAAYWRVLLRVWAYVCIPAGSSSQWQTQQSSWQNCILMPNTTSLRSRCCCQNCCWAVAAAVLAASGQPHSLVPSRGLCACGSSCICGQHALVHAWQLRTVSVAGMHCISTLLVANTSAWR